MCSLHAYIRMRLEIPPGRHLLNLRVLKKEKCRLSQTDSFHLRGSQAERKRENSHKIRVKRENKGQWNEGKKGEEHG